MTQLAHADLRLGKWQDVLADVTCDALIVDAPYSERTHSAHGAARQDTDRDRMPDPNKAPTPIPYDCWAPADVDVFVDFWAPRTRGWFVSITDHGLAPHWAAAMDRHGLYSFSPIAFVAPGSRIRLAGDGPSQWACWIVVARPRSAEFHKWGTLPGSYVLPLGHGGKNAVIGGKPEWLMRSLVRDYTRPGDLVCDPCAGGGTTLLAALSEGRRAVGAEMDPKHYEIARKRLARGFTPPLFSDPGPVAEQLDLTGSDD